MNSSPLTEPATTSDLSRRLAEIKDIDERLAALGREQKELENKREYLEGLCVEDMTAGQIDGIRVAGRSWRIEWNHHVSATAATKNEILLALRAMGIDDRTLDGVTSINTARLKAILKERAEARGIDNRQPWAAGTPLEGKAGEFVAPRLRFTSAG